MYFHRLALFKIPDGEAVVSSFGAQPLRPGAALAKTCGSCTQSPGLVDLVVACVLEAGLGRIPHRLGHL